MTKKLYWWGFNLVDFLEWLHWMRFGNHVFRGREKRE
jgi:hypothetical protein